MLTNYIIVSIIVIVRNHDSIELTAHRATSPSSTTWRASRSKRRSTRSDGSRERTPRISSYPQTVSPEFLTCHAAFTFPLISKTSKQFLGQMVNGSEVKVHFNLSTDCYNFWPSALLLHSTLDLTSSFLFSDKTIKLWKVSERDKRAEGYNILQEDGTKRDPSSITTVRVRVTEIWICSCWV